MFSLALFLVPSAQAYVFWGNPELKVEVDRSEGDLLAGEVDLLGIRVHACDSSYTDYTVGATIDPVDGWSTEIYGGDLCSVEILWDSPAYVWSKDFLLKSQATSHTVSIGGTVSSTAWTPYSVAAGSLAGSDPQVVLTIQ